METKYIRDTRQANKIIEENKYVNGNMERIKDELRNIKTRVTFCGVRINKNNYPNNTHGDWILKCMDAIKTYSHAHQDIVLEHVLQNVCEDCGNIYIYLLWYLFSEVC